MNALHQQDVRSLRLALGWSLQDLAYRMAVDPFTVNCWEEGSKQVDPASAAKLASLFSREAVRRHVIHNSGSDGVSLRRRRVPCLRQPHDDCEIASSRGERRRESIAHASEDCHECVRYARASK